MGINIGTLKNILYYIARNLPEDADLLDQFIGLVESKSVK